MAGLMSRASTVVKAKLSKLLDLVEAVEAEGATLRHVALEEHRAPAALRLGAVHGEIGVPDDVVDPLVIPRVDDHADAGRRRSREHLAGGLRIDAPALDARLVAPFLVAALALLFVGRPGRGDRRRSRKGCGR